MQWFLWTLAILNIGYWARLSVKAKLSQSLGARELDRGGNDVSSPLAGDVVGRLEIPRLNLSTVVFEGADRRFSNAGPATSPALRCRGIGEIPCWPRIATRSFDLCAAFESETWFESADRRET